MVLLSSLPNDYSIKPLLLLVCVVVEETTALEIHGHGVYCGFFTWHLHPPPDVNREATPNVNREVCICRPP
jgi:hypothetical protein